MARTDHLTIVVGIFIVDRSAGRRFLHQCRTDLRRSKRAGRNVDRCWRGVSPLVGIWAPTFSACELAAAFLLPFVAIRLVAGDRQSGGLKLELQQPMSSFARIALKALILLAGWIIATLAPLLGLLLWKSYGGSTIRRSCCR